jgi:hypothetical protein
MALTTYSLAPARSLILVWRGVGMRGDWWEEPFALQLLEQHRRGKTIEQLARETGIPAERIEMRLNAATAYLQRLSESGGMAHCAGRGRRPHRIRLGVGEEHG